MSASGFTSPKNYTTASARTKNKSKQSKTVDMRDREKKQSQRREKEQRKRTNAGRKVDHVDANDLVGIAIRIVAATKISSPNRKSSKTREKSVKQMLFGQTIVCVRCNTDCSRTRNRRECSRKKTVEFLFWCCNILYRELQFDTETCDLSLWK